MDSSDKKKEDARNRAREWYMKNRERALANAKIYREGNKERISQYQAVYRSKNKERISSQKKKWALDNRDKKAELDRVWAEGNREKARLAKRKWYLKNSVRYRIYSHNRRSRIRNNGGDLSINIIADLLSIQSSMCVYCRSDLAVTGFHVDHKVPLSRGGANDDANVQLLCPACNFRKSTKSHDEFIELMGLGE